MGPRNKITGFSYPPNRLERELVRGFNSEFKVAMGIASSKLCVAIRKTQPFSSDDMTGRDLFVQLTPEKRTKHIPRHVAYIQAKSSNSWVEDFYTKTLEKTNLDENQLHDYYNLNRLIVVSADNPMETITKYFEQKIVEMNDFFRSIK